MTTDALLMMSVTWLVVASIAGFLFYRIVGKKNRDVDRVEE